MGERRRTRGGGERNGRSPGCFAAGEEVEVSCDDEGFLGAWYEAAVARPDSRRRRCTVVYTSLLSDDDSSRPLEESVLCSHIRPRPSRGGSARFALHQPVDGFHKDGWWPGIVAKVHPGEGRVPQSYTVCFPSTRELVELAPEEVRPHLRWVRGHWIAPEDHKDVGEAQFGVGELVEVTRDKEYHGAAWFPATVVKVIRKLIFLVEYVSLREDNGELLREIIDAQYIRPSPPQLAKTGTFDLHDEVEAFDDDRWLPGVVFKNLPGSKYIVRPMYKPEDEMEFDHSKLRPAQKWINGQWICISQGKFRKTHRIMKSKVGCRQKSCSGRRSFSPPSVSTLRDGNDEAEHERPLDILASRGKKVEKQSLEGHSEYSQPCKESQNRKLLQNCLQLLDLLVRSLKTLNGRAFEPDDVTDNPSLMSEEQPSECQPEDRCISRMGSKFELCCSDGKHMPICKGMIGSSVCREEPCDFNETGNYEEGFWNARSKVPQNGRKKIVIRAPQQQTKSMKRHAKEETMRTRRCRPGKMIRTEKNGILECTESMQVKDASKQVVEREHGTEVAQKSIIVYVGISQEIHKSGLEVTRLESSPQSVDTERDFPARRTVSIHQASKLNPSNDDHFMKQVEFSAGGYRLIKNSKSSNRIVSSSRSRTWEISEINELNEDGTEAENPVPLSVVSDNTATWNEELSPCSSKEIVMRKGALVDPPPSGLPTKLRTLPFIKNSPIWEGIESMEIFRIMPQQPHFRSLEQYSAELREGMAVGLMVTFDNLVTSVKKLSIVERQESFKEILKALVPLEVNGFNVDCVRFRLEKLLEVRSNRKQVERNKAALEEKFSDLKNVKDHLNAMIPAVDRTIMEVEQNLKHLREKRALAITQGKFIDLEIAKVLKDVHAAEEAFLVAEHHFTTLLNAPW